METPEPINKFHLSERTKKNRRKLTWISKEDYGSSVANSPDYPTISIQQGNFPKEELPAQSARTTESTSVTTLFCKRSGLAGDRKGESMRRRRNSSMDFDIAKSSNHLFTSRRLRSNSLSMNTGVTPDSGIGDVIPQTDHNMAVETPGVPGSIDTVVAGDTVHDFTAKEMIHSSPETSGKDFPSCNAASISETFISYLAEEIDRIINLKAQNFQSRLLSNGTGGLETFDVHETKSAAGQAVLRKTDYGPGASSESPNFEQASQPGMTTNVQHRILGRRDKECSTDSNRGNLLSSDCSTKDGGLCLSSSTETAPSSRTVSKTIEKYLENRREGSSMGSRIFGATKPRPAIPSSAASPTNLSDPFVKEPESPVNNKGIGRYDHFNFPIAAISHLNTSCTKVLSPKRVIRGDLSALDSFGGKGTCTAEILKGDSFAKRKSPRDTTKDRRHTVNISMNRPSSLEEQIPRAADLRKISASEDRNASRHSQSTSYRLGFNPSKDGQTPLEMPDKASTVKSMVKSFSFDQRNNMTKPMVPSSDLDNFFPHSSENLKKQSLRSRPVEQPVSDLHSLNPSGRDRKVIDPECNDMLQKSDSKHNENEKNPPLYVPSRSKIKHTRSHSAFDSGAFDHKIHNKLLVQSREDHHSSSATYASRELSVTSSPKTVTPESKSSPAPHLHMWLANHFGLRFRRGSKDLGSRQESKLSRSSDHVHSSSGEKSTSPLRTRSETFLDTQEVVSLPQFPLSYAPTKDHHRPRTFEKETRPLMPGLVSSRQSSHKLPAQICNKHSPVSNPSHFRGLQKLFSGDAAAGLPSQLPVETRVANKPQPQSAKLETTTKSKVAAGSFKQPGPGLVHCAEINDIIGFVDLMEDLKIDCF